MNSRKDIPNGNGFFRVIELRVEPAQQEYVAKLLTEETDRRVKPFHGFLSAQILRSEDGVWVINFAHWASEADWLAMENDSSVGRAFAAPFSFASETRMRSFPDATFVDGSSPG